MHNNYNRNAMTITSYLYKIELVLCDLDHCSPTTLVRLLAPEQALSMTALNFPFLMATVLE